MDFFKLRGFVVLITLQVVLLCLPLYAQSPDFHFKNIFKEDGLSNNIVNGIVKDKLGFLWIATDNGLCRYDAKGRMKVFKTDIEHDRLHSSMIQFVYNDSKGFLWIGTRHGGLTKINVETNEWTTYRHNPDDNNSLVHDEILCITEDTAGRIWIGTEGGLNILYPEKEYFITFKSDTEDSSALQAGAVLSLWQDNKGMMWVGTWGGGLHLFMPNRDNIAKSTFRNFMTTGEFTHNIIWEIHQDKEGRYWLGEEFGLVYMQVPEKASDEISNQDWDVIFHDYTNNDGLSSRQVFSILSDHHGNLWLGAMVGLNLIYNESLPDISRLSEYNTNKPVLKIHTFYANTNNIFSIPNDQMHYLYEDDQELIWICTTRGLSQFNWRNRQFEFIHLDGVDDHRYGVVTPAGVVLRTPQNSTIMYDPLQKTVQNFDFPPNCNNSTPIDFSINKDQSLCIYTEDGITIYDVENDTCLYNLVFDDYGITIDKSSLLMFIFHENKIWLGSKGLSVFDIQLEQLENYFHHPNDKYSLTDNAISFLETDKYGNLWIATWDGISVLDNEQIIEPTLLDKFKFRNYEVATVGENFISNKISTLKNSTDRMYIGTRNGMMSYEYESDTFLDRTNDEYQFCVHNISDLSDDEVWMSTDEGIINYNPKTQIHKIYNDEYGIDNIQLRVGKSYTDNSGGLYFAGRNAIIRVSPNELIENDKPPPVYITNARILNREGKRELDLIGTNEIQLQHDDYYISFQSSVLNYDSPQKNSYSYHLEGFDDNWTHTKSTEPVVYTNLKAGNYTFRVKAANNEGVWNKEGSSLKIIKNPAYWETRIFKAAVILLIIFAILWGGRIYNKTLRKRYKEIESYNKKLNREISERKKAENNLQQKNDKLSNINQNLEQFAYICSHDLKEPIRGVHSFINLIERRIKKEDTLHKEIAPFFGYTYNYLKTLQNIIASLGVFTRLNRDENLTMNTVHIDDIFEKVELNLSELIREKNVVLKLSNSTDSDTMQTSEYGLLLVLQNLVQNGMKYNTSTTPIIHINLTKQEDNWLFTISDNGIGIDKAYHQYIFEPFKTLKNKNTTNSSGLGLAICTKIITQLGGKIWIESIPDKGSSFYVLLKA